MDSTTRLPSDRRNMDAEEAKDILTIPDHTNFREINEIAQFLEQWAIRKSEEDSSYNPAVGLINEIEVDYDSITTFAVIRAVEVLTAVGTEGALQQLASAWLDGFIMGTLHATGKRPQ